MAYKKRLFFKIDSKLLSCYIKFSNQMYKASSHRRVLTYNKVLFIITKIKLEMLRKIHHFNFSLSKILKLINQPIFLDIFI